MSESTVLVGDIGGTNARFAMASPTGPGYESERVLLCENFLSAELAIQQYLEEVSAPPVKSACLAVAGPAAMNDGLTHLFQIGPRRRDGLHGVHKSFCPGGASSSVLELSNGLVEGLAVLYR